MQSCVCVRLCVRGRKCEVQAQKLYEIFISYANVARWTLHSHSTLWRCFNVPQTGEKASRCQSIWVALRTCCLACNQSSCHNSTHILRFNIQFISGYCEVCVRVCVCKVTRGPLTCGSGVGGIDDCWKLLHAGVLQACHRTLNKGVNAL